MRNLNNLRELKEEKIRLEALAIHQENLIRFDLERIKESFSPGHLVRNAINELFDDPTSNKNIVANSLNFFTGLLAKKFLIHKSNGLIKNFLGYGIEIMISKIIHSKSDSIYGLIQNLFPQKNKDENSTQPDTPPF